MQKSKDEAYGEPIVTPKGIAIPLCITNKEDSGEWPIRVLPYYKISRVQVVLVVSGES